MWIEKKVIEQTLQGPEAARRRSGGGGGDGGVGRG